MNTELSPEHEELESLIPGLALGILEPEEEARLLVHLQGCSSCRERLSEERQGVSLLLESGPSAEPPAGLRRRVLQTATRGARGGRPGGRWVLGAVAAVALLFLGLSLWLAREVRAAEQRLVGLERRVRDQELAVAVLQDPQVQRVPLSGEGPASGARATLFVAGSRAVILVQQMPATPEGMVYQAWVAEDGGRASAGTFWLGPAGAGLYVLEAPHTLADYQAFGVTVEPRPGSPGPTGERVLAASLR